MSCIIGYYLAPYCPFDVKHMLIVFREEDMDGTFLAFNILEGFCRFNQENLKRWFAVRHEDFIEEAEPFVLPHGFLGGPGALAKDAWRKCREYNPRNNRQRYLQNGGCLDRPDESHRVGNKSGGDGEGGEDGGGGPDAGAEPTGSGQRRRSPFRSKKRAAVGRPAHWKTQGMGRRQKGVGRCED